MTRRVVALMVAVLFVAGCLLPGIAHAKEKEKSMFQIMADSLNNDFKKNTKDEIKPVKHVKVFQSMADAIEKGSKKARNLSLRGKK